MSVLGRPHHSRRRAALLEQLIVSLTSAGGERLALRTRVLDDPTIALLDAWATVGDVHGFYLDRIADEGYLSTAQEPGSILALASLLGRGAAPGFAAQTYLAYTMHADPADSGVQFDAGLLFQSVPGPGEQPQTFEAAGALVARPSWNLLKPKSSQPLSVASAADAAKLEALVVTGTTAKLSPNDVILLQLAGTPPPAPVPLTVASAAADLVAQLTTVTLLPADAPSAMGRSAPAGGASPSASAGPASAGSAAAPPADASSALDALLSGGLVKPQRPLPASASDLTRTPETVFAPGADAIPRLISALQPAAASTLYTALSNVAIGPVAVAGASALRVKAAPFGALAPPRTVFDGTGKPAGTVPWPIGDTHALRLSISAVDAVRITTAVLDKHHPHTRQFIAWLRRVAPEMADEPSTDPAIEVACQVGSTTGHGVIDLGKPPWKEAVLGGLGKVLLAPSGAGVALEYEGTAAARVAKLHVTATLNPATDAAHLNFGGGQQEIWDPNIQAPFTATVGDRQLTIAWVTPPGGVATLTMSLETPLPLAAPDVLPLDGIYSGILAGSTVVIDRASDWPPGPAPDVDYPVVATVTAVDTIAASAYGQSSKVTRLTLSAPWIGNADVLQSALRPLTVRAQPGPLVLAPVPVTDDVSGLTIALNSLVAGMEPGRVILVTGTRTDLPAGATLPAGEVAMVARVAVGGGGGDTTYSTLSLAAPLIYTYQRDSVQICANVVTGHQGATITEVLGSGQPSQTHQSFALSTGPPLADPATTGAGVQSTLTVVVDGVAYAEVNRFDDTTPARSYMIGTDPTGKTTVTFAAPLPAGSGNIRAIYRAGDGSQGNVRPGQVSQLLSRPAALSAVTNPLPGRGGTAGAGPEDLRAAAPVGLGGLGRIVSVSDYADLARSVTGVGKATATGAAEGGRQGVVVSVAGTAPVPLDPGDPVCIGLAQALADATDASQRALVEPAGLFLIVLAASVAHDPLVSWEETAAAVRAALLERFGYAQRELGQDVATSDLIAAGHAAPAVRSFTVNGLALVPMIASDPTLAADLSSKLPAQLNAPVSDVTTLAAAQTAWGLAPAAGAPAPACLAFISDTAPDALILTEQRS